MKLRDIDLEKLNLEKMKPALARALKKACKSKFMFWGGKKGHKDYKEYTEYTPTRGITGLSENGIYNEGMDYREHKDHQDHNDHSETCHSDSPYNEAGYHTDSSGGHRDYSEKTHMDN